MSILDTSYLQSPFISNYSQLEVKHLVLDQSRTEPYMLLDLHLFISREKNHSSCNDFTALMRFVSDGKLIEMQYLPDGLCLSHEIPEQNCIHTFSN